MLSGNQPAVFNTTALSTQDEQLFDLTGGISSVLEDRFQTRRRSGAEVEPSLSFLQPEEEQQVWLDTFGSYRNQDEDGQIDANTQWVGA